MIRRSRHPEGHVARRIGWLRAAVLGANDGLLSTSSLIIGVASGHASHAAILVAGTAGVVAGAMSMSAGEYVSVSSQADSQDAEIAKERRELREDRESELKELAGIYVQRGLSEPLALQVADELMKHDALAAHARDELGISEETAARPIQAALSSAAAFAIGAILPLSIALVAPPASVIAAVAVASLVFLAVLGAIGAKIGGANMLKAAARVTFWGVLAMGVTAGIGALLGTRS